MCALAANMIEREEAESQGIETMHIRAVPRATLLVDVRCSNWAIFVYAFSLIRTRPQSLCRDLLKGLPYALPSFCMCSNAWAL